jgi:hypothetical protein
MKSKNLPLRVTSDAWRHPRTARRYRRSPTAPEPALLRGWIAGHPLWMDRADPHSHQPIRFDDGTVHCQRCGRSELHRPPHPASAAPAAGVPHLLDGLVVLAPQPDPSRMRRVHHQPNTVLYGEDFQLDRNVEIEYFDNPDDSNEDRECRIRPAIIAHNKPFVIRQSPFPTCGRSTPSPKSSFTRSRRKRLFSQATTCIELPATTFARALQLACDTPYHRASNYWAPGNGQPGQCERHPALRLLCG